MLLGPFVDDENKLVQDGALTMTYEEIFERAILSRVNELTSSMHNAIDISFT